MTAPAPPHHSGASLEVNTPWPTVPPGARPREPAASALALVDSPSATPWPLLNLPLELLIMILDKLDKISLESLRRASAVFLRVIPDIYPRLFTRIMLRDHPWPVLRLWTLHLNQRRDLLRLLARDLHVGSAGSRAGGGVVIQGSSAPESSVTSAELARKAGGHEVVCRGGMLGLTKAWRYIPCADCGRIHPPRGLPALRVNTKS